MNPTLGVMFAGGGVGTIGLDMAGLSPAWAVEYSPEIAEYHRLNLPGECIIADVSDVDYSQLRGVDFLWTSPSCVNASVANANAGEKEADRQAARAVALAIDELRPRWFALENVTAYRHFDSFKLICDALANLGYWLTWEHVDFSTMGVPQTRRRLILRATMDGLLRCLPPPTRRIGWYEAIEDLLPILPESQFAKWQLARLPAGWENGAAFLHMTRNTQFANPTGTGMKTCDEPAGTVCSSESQSARAFLVDGKNSGQEWGKGYKDSEEPCFTVTGDHPPRAFLFANGCYGEKLVSASINDPSFTVTGNSNQTGVRAFIVDCQSGAQDGLTVRDGQAPMFTVTGSSPKHPARASIPGGRVVAMTPRALARFQSLPDSYVLPEKKSLACRLIGNGMPTLAAKVIAESLIEGEM